MGTALVQRKETDMTFQMIESAMRQGSEKALAVHDHRNKTYYIPRSKITVTEEIEPTDAYDVKHIIIEVPDWLIRKNNIPVFNITELHLVR